MASPPVTAVDPTNAASHDAKDDDSGPGKNARLVHTFSASDVGDVWTIEATSLFLPSAYQGHFSLSFNFVPTCAVDTTTVGTLGGNASVTGAFAEGCESLTRHGAYSKFYQFTIAADTAVTIDLESADADAYLYLRDGAGSDGGAARSEDDNGGDGSNARIPRQVLENGTYTIEATTSGRLDAGAFTLRFSEFDAVNVPAACITAKGTLSGTPDNADWTSQSWASTCESSRVPGAYARYYTFTVPAGNARLMNLRFHSTPPVDSALFLNKGSSRAGDEFVSSVGGTDVAGDAVDGLPAAGNTIFRVIGPGDYIIEATTRLPAQTGSFRLLLNTDTVGDPGTAPGACNWLAHNFTSADITAQRKVWFKSSWDAAATCKNSVSGEQAKFFWTRLQANARLRVRVYPFTLSQSSAAEMRSTVSLGAGTLTPGRSVFTTGNLAGTGTPGTLYQARPFPPLGETGGYGVEIQALPQPSGSVGTGIAFPNVNAGSTSAETPRAGTWSASNPSLCRPGSYGNMHRFVLGPGSALHREARDKPDFVGGGRIPLPDALQHQLRRGPVNRPRRRRRNRNQRAHNSRSGPRDLLLRSHH